MSVGLDRPSKYMKADIVIGLSIKLRFRLLCRCQRAKRRMFIIIFPDLKTWFQERCPEFSRLFRTLRRLINPITAWGLLDNTHMGGGGRFCQPP